MKGITFAFAALPLQALAHFGLTYPVWRADSLAETNASISQWTYPCAGVSTMQNASQPRTQWPIEGGSLKLELHHAWTYIFVNIGFGSEVSNFNVSLNPDGGKLINSTGDGELCWSRLAVPSAEVLGLTVTDGLEASVQVVTVGDSGSALYNCADIVFTANATLLPEAECTNSTGLTAQSIEASNNATSDAGNDDHNATGSATSSSGAAGLTRSSGIVPMITTLTFLLLAGSFVF